MSELRLAPSAGSTEVSLTEIAATLLEARRLIVRVTVFTGLAVVAGLSFFPVTWTSEASFVSQLRRPSGGSAAGLAAQFGVSIGGSDGMQSPQFYADLLQSAPLLRRVVVEPLAVGGRQVQVPAFLGVTETDPARRRELTVQELQKRLVVTMAPRTNVIDVVLRTTGAEESQALLQRILAELDRFNQQTRRTQATAERAFTERRLREVRAGLDSAEQRLFAFLQRNRTYITSSDLRLEEDRLRRDLTLRQQLHITLAQSFEQARIEEVRDTPLLTYLQEPTLAVRPDGRGRLKYGAIAFVVAGLVSAMTVLAGSRLGLDRPGALGLDASLAAAAGDLRRPWRLLLAGRRDEDASRAG